MTIDYNELKLMVKEAMFTQGGINEPSAPEGIPLRQPAANASVDQGDPEANKLYDLALAAREATEQLVEALDDPIYDGAYEHAFKGSACLRRALNSLEDSGAAPTPEQRVVAPHKKQQKYSSYTPANIPMVVDPLFAGGGLAEAEDLEDDPLAVGAGLEPADPESSPLKGFGAQRLSRSEHGKAEREKGGQISTGEILAGVDPKERSMLNQIEQILTDIADKDNLVLYRSWFHGVLKTLLAKVDAKLEGTQ